MFVKIAYLHFREKSRTIVACNSGKSFQAHTTWSCFLKPLVLAPVVTETLAKNTTKTTRLYLQQCTRRLKTSFLRVSPLDQQFGLSVFFVLFCFFIFCFLRGIHLCFVMYAKKCTIAVVDMLNMGMHVVKV